MLTAFSSYRVILFLSYACVPVFCLVFMLAKTPQGHYFDLTNKEGEHGSHAVQVLSMHT